MIYLTATIFEVAAGNAEDDDCHRGKLRSMPQQEEEAELVQPGIIQRTTALYKKDTTHRGRVDVNAVALTTPCKGHRGRGQRRVFPADDGPSIRARERAGACLLSRASGSQTQS